MCYADTEIHDDGTATAFCYFGWSEVCPDSLVAHVVAVTHQRAGDDAEARNAATTEAELTATH